MPHFLVFSVFKRLLLLPQQTIKHMIATTIPQETTLNQPIAFSYRETEILNLIAKGRTSTEIADALCLSINTVETHRKRMIKRVNAKNIFGVFNYTISNGILNAKVFAEPCLL